MAYASSNTLSGFNFAALVNRVVDSVKLANARRAVFNKTYNELANLSDRELDDIGVARSEIRAIAQKEAEMVR